MKNTNSVIWIIIFLVIGVQTLVLGQNQTNDLQLLNKATVSPEEQVSTILEQVKDISGFSFDKLVNSSNSQLGYYSQIYEISTEENVGTPNSKGFISKHNLLITINSFPNSPSISWVVTQIKDNNIVEISMDGSIIEYNSPRKSNSIGTLIQPATISIDDQFNQMLTNANETSGKTFDNLLAKRNPSEGQEGSYSRTYTIKNQKPKYNFSSRTFDEQEFLTINLNRYPLHADSVWHITQWQGESLVSTHLDGSRAIIEKRKLEPHWFSDYGGNFSKILTQASKVTGNAFTQILSEVKNDEVWARAYKTTEDDDFSRVLIVTLMYENNNIAESSWTLLTKKDNQITSLNSNGTTTVEDIE